MKPKKIAVVEEDDSTLEKPGTDKPADKGGKIDYAKMLQEFAEMKEELEKIPTKYDKSDNKKEESSEDYEEDDDLKMNLVKTIDAKDPNEETENIAYSESSKKEEPSEDNDAYEEDFEKSNEVNEEVEDMEEKDAGKVQKNESVADEEDAKSSAKEEQSEDKYGDEDFEKDEENNERKSDKKEEKQEKAVPKSTKEAKDSKKPPAAPVSKTLTKEPPKPAAQSKLAQTAPGKNFKVRTVASAKEPKKENTLPPKEPKKENTLPPKEPKKENTLPPKDPKKASTTNLKPVTKPVTSVKPPLQKRPATATTTSTTGTKKPAANTTKPKEESGSMKIEEDLEVPEEESIAGSESSKPVAEKKLPPVVRRKSLKQKEETPQFEIEENVAATESTVEPTLAVAEKKRPASAVPKSSLSKTQQPKAVTSAIKEDGEEGEALNTSQQAGVRIRKVQKGLKVQKTETKDMMKEIFEEYKKKEEQMRKKDEKIFVAEETEKKIKSVGGSDRSKGEVQENNWVGNGTGLATAVFDTQKKKKTDTTTKKDTQAQTSQGFAQKFLASLESKLGKTSKSTGAGEKTNEAEGKENTKQEKTAKRKESKDTKVEGKDKGWKYAVGEGIDSEYAKKQKEKEAEYKKKFTDLFKKEKAKQQAQKKDNVKKVHEIMNRERENQKIQQQTLVKNFRGKEQDEKKEERDPYVLQTKNIYIEESDRHKKEQQKEEITQLKLKLKLLKQQNEGLEKDLADLKHKESDASKMLDSLASKKAVILLGKTDFTPLGLHTQNRRNNDMISPEKAAAQGSRNRVAEDNFGDQVNVVEKIVNKFADQGFTLEHVFQLIDQNGDSILTTKEIKEGLEKLELELEPEEIKELIEILDKNSDGTIILEEFVTVLHESMKARREYKNIMGDLDQVLNPIVLEERMLDIGIRKKIIQEDLKKEADQVKIQEHDYRKLLRRLKEYEDLAGPQEERKVDLDVYRDNVLKLKIEIQDAEDMKSRTLLMQGERMKDITENIDTLENQIEKIIRRIHNEKKKIKDTEQEAQKEKIKSIFMKKAYGELEREIDKFDSGIDRQIEKNLEEKQRVQGRIEEEENQNAIEDQLMNGAAIRLQRVYRGKMARKKVKQDVFALLKAKNLILRRFRQFKNRIKAKTVESSLKQIRNRRIRLALNAIKEYSNWKREEEEKERERQLEEERLEQERLDEEERQRVEEEEKEKQRELEEEEERQRLEEEEKQRALEAENNRTQEVEESKDSSLNRSELSTSRNIKKKKDVPLYTILYLQGIARKTYGYQKQDSTGLFSQKGEITNCKICAKKPVEIVCKVCEVAVFCAECFALTHRSRKNHPFIEVQPQAREKGLMERIQEEDEQLYEELNLLRAKYRKQFTDLQKHFVDWDLDKTGLFTEERFRESMERKVKEKDDLDLLVRVAQNYCSADADDDDDDDDSKIDYNALAQLLEP